ncbi:hypothetical protein ACFC0D_16390 [Streptomyces sp. NPDC056222]|uniref:hypothetical protein n=1 Tax=Streptomyces sp. NPDC056222 TaxID=3345749 RepID=UPI0035DE76BD
MRSPIRRPRRPHVAALAALVSTLVLAGCSSDGGGGAGTAAASQDAFLQPPAPDRGASVSPDRSTVPGDDASPDDSTPSPSDSQSMTACPSSPYESPTGTPDTTTPDPASPSPSVPPGCPTPTWSEPASPDTPVEPDSESDPPSYEDLFPGETGAQQPETFEG